MSTPPIETKPVKAKATIAPPEERFWQSYSRHFEFPLSTIGSIAAHVLLFAFLVFLLKYAMSGKDKASVPIRVVAVAEGASDGEGGTEGVMGGFSEGQEKVENPTPEPSTPNIIDSPPLVQPEVTVAQFDPDLRDNPDAISQFAKNESVENFSRMEDPIRNKLTKGLQQRNSNPMGSGKAADGNQGSGDGGFGGGKTAKRVMRWTLRFNTRSGQDYLNQLDAMGAILLIPQPPDFRTAKIIRNLREPNGGKEEDLTQITQMHFTDSRADSVSSMSEVLGLGFTPPYFTAFFPKEFEEDLAKKERAYRGRKEEDIAETIFEVVVRNRKYEIRVVDQRPLRGR